MVGIAFRAMHNAVVAGVARVDVPSASVAKWPVALAAPYSDAR